MKDKRAHMSRLKTLRDDISALANSLSNQRLKDKWFKHTTNIDEILAELETVQGESR